VVAWRLYGYAFLAECVPLYPVYALLFADAGVSPAGISALFAVWSATSFLAEVPAGVWADKVSRRLLVTLSPALEAAGYGLWVAYPVFWSFLGGFVLLGVGGALRSGALEALVYGALDSRGVAAAFPRLIGRAQGAGGLAELVATVTAGPLFVAGGYRLIGLVSVAALAACVAAARLLPADPRRGPTADGDPGDTAGGPAALARAAVTELRGSGAALRAAALSVGLTAVAALDEYLPLLARGTGVSRSEVPWLVGSVSAACAVGGWAAGSGGRLTGPLLAVAGVALAAGTGSGAPLGFAGVAVTFGIVYWALARAEAGLQGGVTDRARATVGSFVGAAREVAALAAFGAYAAGSSWLPARWMFAGAALPCLLLAALAWRTAKPGRTGRPVASAINE
jgi:hypothetical protein